ncbi:hypothetical protein BHE74_00016739 [Ensete ventricosum]|uniref:Uncharacterized protein n=1 Tax=Ensete ventricosum TaxID=4639 RepID=A0A426ZTL2_ENSVE|nr:hypothetical protein B296_00023985 [Ensete ventricosum]RWW14185.1 hypothetical protein GW17_00022064 [Ensete ventricosum]RWW75256.1 hypothetical protein BHE74_00016739 [Ensete ventricosum]RZR94457.1 hypothetical protein BHM03_00023143 [Ensete ventricosum]
MGKRPARSEAPPTTEGKMRNTPMQARRRSPCTRAGSRMTRAWLWSHASPLLPLPVSVWKHFFTSVPEQQGSNTQSEKESRKAPRFEVPSNFNFHSNVKDSSFSWTRRLCISGFEFSLEVFNLCLFPIEKNS